MKIKNQEPLIDEHLLYKVAYQLDLLGGFFEAYFTREELNSLRQLRSKHKL